MIFVSFMIIVDLMFMITLYRSNPKHGHLNECPSLPFNAICPRPTVPSSPSKHPLLSSQANACTYPGFFFEGKHVKSPEIPWRNLILTTESNGAHAVEHRQYTSLQLGADKPLTPACNMLMHPLPSSRRSVGLWFKLSNPDFESNAKTFQQFIDWAARETFLQLPMDADVSFILLH